jgi:hypothetical protein
MKIRSSTLLSWNIWIPHLFCSLSFKNIIIQLFSCALLFTKWFWTREFFHVVICPEVCCKACPSSFNTMDMSSIGSLYWVVLVCVRVQSCFSLYYVLRVILICSLLNEDNFVCIFTMKIVMSYHWDIFI